MTLISFTPLADGVTAVNAAATNTPLSTIYNDYNGSITNANISASAAIDGSKLAFGGTWSTWTPTWTNITPGNATVVARYVSVGKIVFYHLQFTFGSTSSISAGDSYFTLPATAGSSYSKPYAIVMGNGCVFHSTTAYPLYVGTGTSTSNAVIQSGVASGTPLTQGAFKSTVPTSGLTTGDWFELSGFYEAA